MRIQPIAINHVEIILDDHHRVDVNDGTPHSSLNISLPVNSNGKFQVEVDHEYRIIRIKIV